MMRSAGWWRAASAVGFALGSFCALRGLELLSIHRAVLADRALAENYSFTIYRWDAAAVSILAAWIFAKGASSANDPWTILISALAGALYAGVFLLVILQFDIIHWGAVPVFVAGGFLVGRALPTISRRRASSLDQSTS